MMYSNQFGYCFDIKDGVNLALVKPIALTAAHLVGRVIYKKCDKPPVITSGWRDVSGQIKAMENMKQKTPDLYKEVYSGMLSRGQSPDTMPHPSGRAVDWRFSGYETAEDALRELNHFYLEGVEKIVGYKPSSLIVIEKQGNINVCFHVQVPPTIPDEKKYESYLFATLSRV